MAYGRLRLSTAPSNSIAKHLALLAPECFGVGMSARIYPQKLSETPGQGIKVGSRGRIAVIPALNHAAFLGRQASRVLLGYSEERRSRAARIS
jgi:hypothetical protein